MKRPFEAPLELRGEFAGILRGEYAIPQIKFDKPPIVLDCGANVGAFSTWARTAWPDCKVIAYEPSAKVAAVFRRNCPGIELHERAILGGAQKNHLGFRERPRDMAETIRLYDGKNNSGQASLFPGEYVADSFQEVRTLWAGDLPNCDFLKIDTEGSEIPILQDYKFLHNVTGVALEFHAQADQWKIGQLLSEAGLICSMHAFWKTGTGGVMKWRRP